MCKFGKPNLIHRFSCVFQTLCNCHHFSLVYLEHVGMWIQCCTLTHFNSRVGRAGCAFSWTWKIVPPTAPVNQWDHRYPNGTQHNVPFGGSSYLTTWWNFVAGILLVLWLAFVVHLTQAARGRMCHLGETVAWLQGGTLWQKSCLCYDLHWSCIRSSEKCIRVWCHAEHDWLRTELIPMSPSRKKSDR